MNVGAIAGASAASTAAAAAAKRRRNAEEEKMTGYRPEDLEGWEFKIVRSASGAFKKRDKMAAILEEESRAGWQLVEKFDDNRLRLKRETDQRQMDTALDFDPYRTWVGMTPNALAGWILLGIFGPLIVTVVLVAILGN